MDPAAKQQIVERIKQANNILVTVSNNPTIDQLAACIGVTLLLNKMDKHATAVYSGKTPSTIEFLQPAKTLESNTDSLRDFIISLDKNKADKLRYKVEDQVVRIYISPYKTSLSEKDLVFSQGDFNVELVLALGITDRAQLDAAIASHGRILHDATTVAINAGPAAKGQGIGQINWQDPNASSLSEIIVSLSEAFGPGLIDNQIATAFLTGIVAETDRFSNKHTSPKVMTMSAQLMAAGANQQLVISKLEPPPPPPPKNPSTKQAAPTNASAQPKSQAVPPAQPKDDGILSVAHEPAELDSPEVEINSDEIRIDEKGNLQDLEDQAKAQAAAKLAADSVPMPPPPDAGVPIAPLPPAPEPYVPTSPPPMPVQAAPQVPATLPPISPAVSSLPASPTMQPPSSTPGHVLMDPMAPPPSFGSSFSSDTGQQAWQDPYGSVSIDPLNNDPNMHQEAFASHSRTITPPPQPSLVPPQPTPPAPVLGDPLLAAPPAAPLPPPVDSARSAVESALAAAPFDPASNPVQALNAQPMVPEPSALPPPPAIVTPSLNLPFGDQNPLPAPPPVPVNLTPPPPTPPPIPQMPA